MRRLETQVSSTSGVKPFLDTAFDKGLVLQGDLCEVIRVNESKSKAGFIIHCDKFMVHIYKSAPICDVLQEALEELIRQNPAPALLIEVDEQAGEGFHLVIGDDTAFLWTRTKKFGGISAFLRTNRSGGQRRPTGKKEA